MVYATHNNGTLGDCEFYCFTNISRSSQFEKYDALQVDGKKTDKRCDLLFDLLSLIGQWMRARLSLCASSIGTLPLFPRLMILRPSLFIYIYI